MGALGHVGCRGSPNRPGIRARQHLSPAFACVNHRLCKRQRRDAPPPEKVLAGYRATLKEAGWQNAIIDTASTANRDWSGVHMSGPYAWRSPAFWFDPDNVNAKGSVLEKGNNSLEGIHRVIAERYGEAHNLPEFVAKAQLAQYESARALFEAYGARGWRTHKMTVYWMLNSSWPSFFGQLFDHYFGAGGSYFGAKKGRRPISVVFDSFAVGDHTRGQVILANHSTETLNRNAQ
jgi:exo-1,4-beta-D-glucosaminidase